MVILNSKIRLLLEKSNYWTEKQEELKGIKSDTVIEKQKAEIARLKAEKAILKKGIKKGKDSEPHKDKEEHSEEPNEEPKEEPEHTEEGENTKPSEEKPHQGSIEGIIKDLEDQMKHMHEQK